MSVDGLGPRIVHKWVLGKKTFFCAAFGAILSSLPDQRVAYNLGLLTVRGGGVAQKLERKVCIPGDPCFEKLHRSLFAVLRGDHLPDRVLGPRATLVPPSRLPPFTPQLVWHSSFGRQNIVAGSSLFQPPNKFDHIEDLSTKKPTQERPPLPPDGAAGSWPVRCPRWVRRGIAHWRSCGRSWTRQWLGGAREGGGPVSLSAPIDWRGLTPSTHRLFMQGPPSTR